MLRVNRPRTEYDIMIQIEREEAALEEREQLEGDFSKRYPNLLYDGAVKSYEDEADYVTSYTKGARIG